MFVCLADIKDVEEHMPGFIRVSLLHIFIDIFQFICHGLFLYVSADAFVLHILT